jgi:hypothetical protein
MTKDNDLIAKIPKLKSVLVAIRQESEKEKASQDVLIGSADLLEGIILEMELSDKTSDKLPYPIGEE